MQSNETPLSFGPDGTLVGVLTRPVNGARSTVGCLLLNVGVNPRIGPRRINVKAARELASAGIPCLRFDLSGVGDSRASGGQADFRQQAQLDMRAALDQLQAATGIHQFIVFGICSGAANGMALALADPRVVGLLMFDGYIFLTRTVRLQRKLRRWAAFPFNPSLRRSFHAWNDWMGWARAPLDATARAKALGRLWGRAAPQNNDDNGLFNADGPEYDAPDFERDMGKLVARGVDLYLMYSATLNAADRDRDLLSGLRGAPFLEHVRYKHWTDIDHTITMLAAQHKLLEAVRTWALELAARQRSGAADGGGEPAEASLPDAQPAQPTAPGPSIGDAPQAKRRAA
jgi:pimeloyl-ACP methyl ester carboxylesterase